MQLRSRTYHVQKNAGSSEFAVTFCFCTFFFLLLLYLLLLASPHLATPRLALALALIPRRYIFSMFCNGSSACVCASFPPSAFLWRCVSPGCTQRFRRQPSNKTPGRVVVPTNAYHRNNPLQATVAACPSPPPHAASSILAQGRGNLPFTSIVRRVVNSFARAHIVLFFPVISSELPDLEEGGSREV